MRAQASVLKRAVLDEQSKSSTLRESIRAKETALRRAEQEVDSLSFRNKQLEVRVASLQDDLVQDTKKSSKVTKTKSKATNNDDVPQHNNDTSLLFNEDLQKKIFENVRLETLVADKQSELQLQVMRIEELEARVAKMTADQSEHEGRLRRELERISAKNHDLEAKLVEASSIVGSDDTLYVSSECEQQQHTAATTCGDERVKAMEKELVYWRTQYEILKIGQKMQEQQCVAPNNVGHVEAGGDRDLLAEDKLRGEPENLLFNHFTVKIQELFGQKCMAESKLRIYVEEVSWEFSFVSADIESKNFLTIAVQLAAEAFGYSHAASEGAGGQICSETTRSTDSR